MKVCLIVAALPWIHQVLNLVLLATIAVGIGVASLRGGRQRLLVFPTIRAAEIVVCVLVILAVAHFSDNPVRHRRFYTAAAAIAVYAFLEEAVFREFLGNKLLPLAKSAIRNGTVREITLSAASTAAFVIGHFLTSSSIERMLATGLSVSVARLSVMGFCFWSIFRLRGLLAAAMAHALINLAVLSYDPYEGVRPSLWQMTALLVFVVSVLAFIKPREISSNSHRLE